jgi:HAUS augmin-like complex subunit 6 N-terminus
MLAPASKAEGSATFGSRKVQTIKPVEWTGPSNIATFLRCLRLLDLDLREDWPDVTEQVFSSKNSQQNLQQRVKYVEWGLYRLFEIWDPTYTKDVRCASRLHQSIH